MNSHKLLKIERMDELRRFISWLKNQFAHNDFTLMQEEKL